MNKFLRKIDTIRFVAPWSIFINFLRIFYFLNSNLNFEFGPVWYRPKPEPVQTDLTGNWSNRTGSRRFCEPCSWLALLPCFLRRSSSRVWWQCRIRWAQSHARVARQLQVWLPFGSWMLNHVLSSDPTNASSLSAVALKPIQSLKSAREDEQNTVRYKGYYLFFAVLQKQCRLMQIQSQIVKLFIWSFWSTSGDCWFSW